MEGSSFGMEVTVQPDLGLVITMTGALDLASVGTASLVLADALDGFSGDAWLDLAEVTFMNACGADMIARARRRMALRGRTLALLAASPPARRVLSFDPVSWDLAPANRSAVLRRSA
jgi:anti-anti-sigma factor